MKVFRNAIKAIFGGIKNFVTSTWKELGNYAARFSSFGNDIYANDVVRACIRTLAEHTSKANAKVIRRTENGVEKGDTQLQYMLTYRPNFFMNGKEFLEKARNIYEIYNTLFIYIMRNESGKVTGYYPMPGNASLEAVDVNGRLYIKFNYPSGVVMCQAWEDLAVLRKDYVNSDVFGEANTAILTSLDLLNTTNEGMANAIQSTANLRGIIKSKKAMLSNDDVKEIQKRFVDSYMTMTNTSGVAALDATQDFVPVELKPQLANYKSVEDLRLNIYRYFGISEEIILAKANAETREAFYEARIEPFLLALSLELTYKTYTDKATRGFGNEILFESNRMSYMSMGEKLALVAMVDRGAMTPNEWRQALNLAPIQGGDMPVRRLDTAPVGATQNVTEDTDNDNE